MRAIGLLVVMGCMAINSWSQTTTITRYYGIFTDNPAILNRMPIDDVTGHIYIWENTLTADTATPAEGGGVLAWKSNNVGWWGFGIHDDRKPSLLDYKNGYLVFSVRTFSTDAFEVDVFGASNSKGIITFAANGGPQGFQRDGKWYRIEYPIAELVKQGLKLNQVAIPFAAVGGTNISDIAFDDIYYYAIDTLVENPTNPGTAIHTLPNQNVRCYPNPAKDYFFVQTSSVNDEVNLYSITGKLLATYRGIAEGTIRISTQNMPKGLYIVQVKNQLNTINQKILIQ